MPHNSITHTRHAALRTVRIICRLLSSWHGTVWKLRKLPAFRTTCCFILPDRSTKETTCSFKPFISYYLVSDCPLNFQHENLTFPNDFSHTTLSSTQPCSPERMPGSLNPNIGGCLKVYTSRK